MKFELKDYQEDAVAEVLDNLRDAREDFHRERPRRSAFSLTAVTGAGKTVMAAAIIEALFAGNDELAFPADPGAVVLWFTSDPALNEQTRHRIHQAADRIPYNHLQVIGSTFSDEKLAPGRVYFLNSQKLAKTSLLVRGGSGTADDAMIAPDMRARTFWETLRNTIEDPDLTLYLILDEAHRGMKPQTTRERDEKSSIVRQLINGEAGAPPIPVVLGISATVQRFNDAMAGAEGRLTLPNVVVDPRRVQDSGLLKDDIRLSFPTESGQFDMVLLRVAVRRARESTELWRNYSDQQGLTDDPVTPLLVVQVPNKPTDAMLLDALGTITDEWPELSHDAIANVFSGGNTLQVGQHSVPYVSPEDVQDRSHIRVLLAKDAISTGWDCPRAEVLVSFRPAQDETHITQLLGRMVRTPLARRVPGDDRLNSVECLLPFFNRATATTVADVMLGHTLDRPDVSTADDTPRLLIAPKDMEANASVSDAIWSVFDELPSETVPRRGARPTRRLNGLAHALAYDGLLPDARKQANEQMLDVLDGLAARYAKKVTEKIDDITTLSAETIIAHVQSGMLSVGTSFSELADERTVDAEFKSASRVLGAALASTYADRLEDVYDDGYFTAHLRVAALAKVEEVSPEVDRAAFDITEDWFGRFRVAIKGLPDDRRALYADLRALAAEPLTVPISRPKVRSESTQTPGGQVVPSRPKHLMSDDSGEYPIGSLRPLEVTVLDRELPYSTAWYRNPGRASADALAIAYQDRQGRWARLCPDFVFFTKVGDTIKPSIVDPHGDWIGDALPKLKGLSRYAEWCGENFHRIEAVSSVNGTLRVLDLTNAKVRNLVETAADATEAYLSDHAHDY